MIVLMTFEEAVVVLKERKEGLGFRVLLRAHETNNFTELHFTSKVIPFRHAVFFTFTFSNFSVQSGEIE